jgi:hypothetical protein
MECSGGTTPPHHAQTPCAAPVPSDYSRDSRPDCLQVVIALVVTPDGFPLAYEVMGGNASQQKTLRPFLDRIEKIYGKARRVWVMDRGIATEATLAEVRASGEYYWCSSRQSALPCESSPGRCDSMALRTVSGCPPSSRAMVPVFEYRRKSGGESGQGFPGCA